MTTARILSSLRSFRPRAMRPLSSLHGSATLRAWVANPQPLSPMRLQAFSSSAGSDSPRESKEEAKAKEPQVSSPLENIKGTEMEFQAETRQLLDIVTNSLYTDKEVFLRELVSNASDALEKLRHVQLSNKTMDPDAPLEIRIDLDEVTSTITISDTGIGMTNDEMVQNLGTIARSGSKEFINDIGKDLVDGGADPSRGIIGKFGVGFYASFMVGEKVEVRSRSATSDPDAPAKVWISEGKGSYEIADLPDNVRQSRGSSIVIHLKEAHWDFVDATRIEGILKRYSNFVNFPIYLNGNRVNTLEAVWGKDPKEVSEEEYTAFYRYIANAIDEPLDTYHFRADAPLDIKALFFIPSFHSEKYGMGRMEPGVNLYSRKVLIESKSPDILPDWMRFLKGAVDSEDLPLSISREKPQDSSLITRLRSTLSRKFIAHLTAMVKKDKTKYLDEFYKEYNFFVKEGICQDYESQAKLSKLLYFETSKNLESELVSLDEYIGRMRPEQKDIYYIVAPSRSAALSSPYLEAFDKEGVEVLFLFTAIDDFVMANLVSYEGRKLVSVEKGDIDLNDLKETKGDDDSGSDNESLEDQLTKEQQVEFCNWFKNELGDKKVGSCVVTSRLSSSPAIVTDNESGAMRRMMQLVDTNEGSQSIALPKQNVEINPKHPLIVGIHKLVKTEPILARVLAEQVFDNCLVAAGILDDGRSMLPRLNDILLCVTNGALDPSSSMSQNQSVSDSGADSDPRSPAKAKVEDSK